MSLFLTKGETNWRFIVIVIVITILVGGGIFHSLNRFHREIIYFSQFSEIEKPERIIEGQPVAIEEEESERVTESQSITWETYQIISAMTREPIYGVSFMLPETARRPLCDQPVCYSQGTELPGKTRFQVAAWGEGEYLFYSWEEFKEDLIKKEFFVTDILVNDKEAIEFWKDENTLLLTHGGYGFSKMRGVAIKLNDKKFIEVSHFIPEGEVADFENDNQLFKEIISAFVFYEEEKEPEEEFCGWSTEGVCVSDADCILGGCSSQVCQSKNEEPVVTTCEFRECYLAQNYGLGCKCFNNKCQWLKESTLYD